MTNKCCNVLRDEYSLSVIHLRMADWDFLSLFCIRNVVMSAGGKRTKRKRILLGECLQIDFVHGSLACKILKEFGEQFCVCVCACVRACVRACVCVCVCAFVQACTDTAENV